MDRIANLVDSDPEPWRRSALCAQIDPALWFNIEHSVDTATAKRICGACSVRSQCLDRAMVDGDVYGVWGGMTRTERRRLARRST